MDEVDDLTYEDIMDDGPPDPILPFGVHRGSYASQVNVAYLKWLVRRTWLQDPLKSNIRDHLETRSGAKPNVSNANQEVQCG